MSARRSLAALVLCVLLLGGCADRGAPSELVSFGRFRDVHVYRPQRAALYLALFLSGDGGWSPGLGSIAARLSETDTVVAGIDARDLLGGYRSASGACASPAAELEALASELRRRYQLPEEAPVLIGHSAGATLAYVALVQAPPGTFMGALTLSFCAELDLAVPLCRALPSVAQGGGVRLLPAASLPAPWLALHGLEDQECPAAAAQGFVGGISGAQFVALPGIAHTYRHIDRWWPQFEAAFRQLTASPPPPR